MSKQSSDPHVGTWKLNLAKSKYNPGPPPKSGTGTIKARDNGIKSEFDMVLADGNIIHVECAPKYDGKDYPLTGVPNADMVSLTRIDANITEYVYKKGGREVGRALEVFSKDGKTRTRTLTETNTQGQDFIYIAVFDKQ